MLWIGLNLVAAQQGSDIRHLSLLADVAIKQNVVQDSMHTGPIVHQSTPDPLVKKRLHEHESKSVEYRGDFRCILLWT